MGVEVTDDRYEEAWAWAALIATARLATAIVFLITGARCVGVG